MNTQEQNLNKLHSLAVFRSLLNDPVIKRLEKLLAAGEQTNEQIDRYSALPSQGLRRELV